MTSNVKQLEPTDLHRRFAYNDKQTLLALYEQLALEDIPPQSLMASISTAVLFNNLILVPGGWLVRFFYNRLSVQKKFLYCTGVIQAMIKDNQLNAFYAGMLVHMVNGVDKTDPASAGGWNASEFCVFLHILNQLGYEYTPQPGLENDNTGT